VEKSRQQYTDNKGDNNQSRKEQLFKYQGSGTDDE